MPTNREPVAYAPDRGYHKSTDPNRNDDRVRTPDAATLPWVSGVLHEDRIAPWVASTVRQRALSTIDSPEYWSLVCSVVIDHVVADLQQQAREWPAG